MKKPTFLIFGLADLDPEALHNIIADAVGEPRDLDTNPRRNLRKDNRAPKKTPGGNSNDESSSGSQ